jgi:RNA-binding protein 25
MSFVQLNVNQATREYLERYVAKKKDREKFLQQQAAQMEKDMELAPGVEIAEAPKPKEADADKDPGAEEDAKKFGLVSSSDIQADEAATTKLNSMLEERLLTYLHKLFNFEESFGLCFP